MSYLEREGFFESADIVRVESADLPTAKASPKLPSVRFAVAAMFVSVASAGLLALGLVVFTG